MEQAEVVVDRLDRGITRSDLREELDVQFRSFRNELTAAWRRDLLMISVPQFIALAAILLTVGA